MRAWFLAFKAQESQSLLKHSRSMSWVLTRLAISPAMRKLGMRQWIARSRCDKGNVELFQLPQTNVSYPEADLSLPWQQYVWLWPGDRSRIS